LDGDLLSYYDNVHDSESKTNGKHFQLQPLSAVSYTAREFLFLLKVTEQDDRSDVGPDDWYLMAESEG
jgi:hypothetical protein